MAKKAENKETEIVQKTVLTEKVEKKREHIKLHVPGESFWAIKLSEDTAAIDNILLDANYGLGDIVKFRASDNEVLSIIEKKTNTYCIQYKVKKDIEETKEIYKKIYEYLEEKNIRVEGMMAGVALIAVPIGIPEKILEEIVEACPIKLSFYGENEE